MCKGEHDLVYMYPAACRHMILYAFILLYVNISTCVFLHACTLFEALFCSSLFVLCPGCGESCGLHDISLFVVVMGERKVLRVSGSHGGNLWMMVSPTVTERGSVFQVGRLSQSLSMHTHTHTTRSLTHTPHAAGSGSMATCDTGTSLCRHRHIISRYTSVLVWSSFAVL